MEGNPTYSRLSESTPVGVASEVGVFVKPNKFRIRQASIRNGEAFWKAVSNNALERFFACFIGAENFLEPSAYKLLFEVFWVAETPWPILKKQPQNHFVLVDILLKFGQTGGILFISHTSGEISGVHCEAEFFQQRQSVQITTAAINRLNGKSQIENPVFDDCETDILPFWPFECYSVCHLRSEPRRNGFRN
jgi:hypothetical protein